MKIPRCDIATHGLKGALRSQGGCRFCTPPRYNSNCTKERSSAEVCTRDRLGGICMYAESTQSETPEGAFQSERGRSEDCMFMTPANTGN